jgi:hypothetical protein
MEIRSYRRVFDLERRIYRVDQVRLNPGGIPVRGVAYFLVIAMTSLAAARTPGLRTAAAAVPWYLRDLAFPVVLASLLTAMRVDGRPFHLAALSLARLVLESRHVDPLGGRRERDACGHRWHPQPVLMLADGSDHRLRRAKYTGPGAVHFAAPHECAAPRADARRRLGLGALVVVRARTARGGDADGRVIVLGRRARLRVR